jgi:uncharacterized membrane protein YphA (DoxX/SURF4 family)
MNYLAFSGRILIGLPFAMSGVSKLAAYGPTTAKIAAVGLPFPPLAFAMPWPSNWAADCFSFSVTACARLRLGWLSSRSRQQFRSTAISPTRTR